MKEQHSEALKNLGYLYYQRGEYKKAKRRFLQAAKYNSELSNELEPLIKEINKKQKSA